MQGVFRLMPLTSVIMVIGMLSMLLPPFGVLMTKWLAIEAAVRLPVGLVLIVLGSGFTVVFWVQWIGNVLTMSHKQRRRIEDAMPSIRFSLVFMGALVLAGTAAVSALYRAFAAPYLSQLSFTASDLSWQGGAWRMSSADLVSGFGILQAFMLVMVALAMLFYLFLRRRPSRFEPPWVGGELANHDIRGIEFVGPGDRVEQILVHSYYLEGVFSEKYLSIPASFISALLIVTMLWVGI
jgi:ech hydrogenase subunit A